MNKNNRCFGITKWRLCRRRGNWRLLCHDHRYQWIGLLIFLFLTLGGCTIWNIAAHLWPKVDTFTLADCTFDAVLEISPDGLEKFRRAFPDETGTLSIILNIFSNEFKGEYVRLQLTGKWQGTSGMTPIYQEDVVIFTLSERQFTLLHKKPIIEFVPHTMRHLSVGRHYKLELTAFPGFAVPLVPKKIFIRTHNGIVYSISDFTGPDRGWYFATFSP